MRSDLNYRLDDGDRQGYRTKADGREEDISAADTANHVLFWSFPGGRGAVQPWRRKLWELQNKSGRE